ncbi:hypothetical protein H6802_02740 [Candidatus Nomurabacteria bacterium]|nr:hypothetical protein [Candidatus Nomurabacteria bacterium]MCB9827168.1 hypothetical protein [Candidatus Nomurabacteria bacterium]MCB9827791.1 hypothetical protein [Candidatus Nomurabacteria bacterium]
MLLNPGSITEKGPKVIAESTLTEIVEGMYITEINKKDGIGFSVPKGASRLNTVIMAFRHGDHIVVSSGTTTGKSTFSELQKSQTDVIKIVTGTGLEPALTTALKAELKRQDTLAEKLFSSMYGTAIAELVLLGRAPDQSLWSCSVDTATIRAGSRGGEITKVEIGITFDIFFQMACTSTSAPAIDK